MKSKSFLTVLGSVRITFVVEKSIMANSCVSEEEHVTLPWVKRVDDLPNTISTPLIEVETVKVCLYESNSSTAVETIMAILPSSRSRRNISVVTFVIKNDFSERVLENRFVEMVHYHSPSLCKSLGSLGSLSQACRQEKP